jgi:hypothetical protein
MPLRHYDISIRHCDIPIRHCEPFCRDLVSLYITDKQAKRCGNLPECQSISQRGDRHADARDDEQE